MIYLTEAANDRSLLPMFGGLATLAPLTAGDFAFFGKWTDGQAVRVCGERKKVPDLVACIGDGRYLNQVRAAKEASFDFLFLIVEGMMRPGSDGLLEVYKGKGWRPLFPHIEYKRVDNFLDQVAFIMGVKVKRSMSVKETVAQVIDVYSMFQKAPDEHTSMQQFYTPPLPTHLFIKPGLVRRMAKELAGIGWDRALAVDRAFHSVREMTEATEKDWLAVEGIGKKTANSAYEEIRRTRA